MPDIQTSDRPLPSLPDLKFKNDCVSMAPFTHSSALSTGGEKLSIKERGGSEIVYEVFYICRGGTKDEFSKGRRESDFL